MTLCLMVYNLAEYWLRQTLEQKNETLPNQLKKEIQNPSFKWICQLMRGISIAYVYDSDGTLIQRSVCNLNSISAKIIRLFGIEAQKIYAI